MPLSVLAKSCLTSCESFHVLKPWYSRLDHPWKADANWMLPQCNILSAQISALWPQALHTAEYAGVQVQRVHGMQCQAAKFLHCIFAMQCFKWVLQVRCYVKDVLWVPPEVVPCQNFGQMIHSRSLSVSLL